MQEKNAGRLDPLLITVGVLLLYAAFPSYLHLFDGVACAIAVELGDFKHLVHGNHLLYGIVGYAFHRLLFLAGLKLPALWTLQVLDSLLGAAAAGLMASTLLRARFSRFTAAFCSLGMAVSYAYWKWSLEANVYLLGVVFLMLALREAVDDRPNPYALAFWHALAMLAHAANALFVPVALLALWRRRDSGGDPRSDTAKYLLTAAAWVCAVYVAAAVMWVQPETASDVKLWLMGSGALGPGRTWRWQGSETFLERVYHWVLSSGKAVSVLPWLGAPLWAAAYIAFFVSRGKGWLFTLAGWVWLYAYSALFMNWQPYNIIYRITDLPALWIMAAPVAEWLAATPRSSSPRTAEAVRSQWRSLLGAYLCALFAVNLSFVILPDSRPENNAPLQEALWLKAATPENAWIAVENNGQVYVPYFSHRSPLNLHLYRGREAALVSRIREIQRDEGPVFVTGELLDQGWRQVFTSIGMSEAARSPKTVLYRVAEL